MKLNKDNVEVSVLKNFKGGEKELRARMYTDENVKILNNAVLIPGASIGLHTHEGSCEIIHIISGVGTVLCNNEEEILYPGDTHYCKEGDSHTLMNKSNEDLLFFAVIPNIK